MERIAVVSPKGQLECPECGKNNGVYNPKCSWCDWVNPYASALSAVPKAHRNDFVVLLADITHSKDWDVISRAMSDFQEGVNKQNQVGDVSALKIEIAKEQIFVATTASFPDLKILEYKGLARGSTVRAKHIGRDIAASIKNIVGGEIKGYTELLADGREEALDRMKIDAMNLGANAVVEARFSSSMIDVGACEIVAYGTAVLVDK